jgi:alpha-D-ribose 1-methylphosphonate 5-triphosphate synthase subunit PhnG
LSQPPSNGHATHAERLSVLSQAPADQVKALAESLLARFGAVEVIENRTGLVMLPYTDSVKGGTFYLGEVLIAEAHISLKDHHVEGYAACLGRDTQQALAIALLEAALRANLCLAEINRFISAQATALAEADAQLLQQVEATRVNLETF